MSLDARIQSIFRGTAQEIVAAVRAALADEIKHLSGVRRANGAKSASGGGRRSSKQIAAVVDKLLTFIRKNAGLRAEQIMKRVGGSKVTIKDALGRLRATGKVKTKGIKRAMSYRAAT